jgi:L-rhamnose mutarotase
MFFGTDLIRDDLNHPWRFSLRRFVFMPRVAFRLRIKSDAVEGYERDHANVWPGLLAKLKEVGISDYSIFRRGQDLFLVMQVKDFDSAWNILADDPINLRWQAEMAKYFEPVPGLEAGERFAMMKEVFHME